jgi:protein-disulfide isomerase
MNALRLSVLLLALVTTGATCNRNNDETGETPSAAAVPLVELPGVKLDALTPREHQLWSGLVSELLSPCADVAVPVAQCVKEKRECALCLPAAEFLVRQVTSGRPKADISSVYQARFDPKAVKTVAIDESPAKGSKEPAVTIVEFADFECGACAAAFPLLETMYSKYGKQMRMVFKHFPLAAHPNAKLAAQAAYAAQKQGHFWKMHKMLFDNHPQLSEPELLKYAQEIGLDIARFKKDMHSDEAKKSVERDKKQGETLGVSATPTILINGRDCDLSKLANPAKDLEDWIELEITRAKPKQDQ